MFYEQLQSEQVAMNGIRIVQDDGMQNLEKMLPRYGICGTGCRPMTNDRGLRIFEFASSNDLIRFRSSVNFPKIITFPAIDIGGNHDLVRMTFRWLLKRAQQQASKRMRYNLDGLKSSNLMQQFNAVLKGKFYQLIDLTDTDVDVDKLTKTFNTPKSGTATEVSSMEMPMQKETVDN